MKYHFCIFALCGLLIANSNAFSQVVFMPSKPKISEKISFLYDPSTTPLANSTSIKATVLFIDDNIFSKGSLVPIVVTKDRKHWFGKFEMGSKNEVQGAILFFSDNTGKITDDNQGKGYSVFIHDFNGQVKPKANIALSIGLRTLTRNKSLKFSVDKLYQLSLLENEFLIRPELKKTYRGEYMSALVNTQKEGYQKILYEELQEMEQKPTELRASEMALLRYFYDHLGDKKKVEYYTQKINFNKKDDNSFSDMVYVQRIAGTADTQQKITLFKEFETALPNSKWLIAPSIDIAYQYVELGDNSALKTHLGKYESKIPSEYKSMFFNRLSKKIFEKNQDLTLAEAYAIKAQTIPINKDHAFTLGLIQEKKGKNEEAYDTFKSALSDNIGTSKPEVNERYIASAIKIGKKQEALIAAEQYIKADKATTAIKDIFKTLYLELNGVEAPNKYFDGLDVDLQKKYKNELINSIIDEPAPDFVFQDIEGKSINTANFKGQITIIDFWATWCPNCKKIVPSIQDIEQKYNGKKIRFLHINTQEKGENDVQTVQDFIAKQKNSIFKTFFDTNEFVYNRFRINNIPTIVIIDTNGKIRFRIEVFEDEDLERKINTIVEILKEDYTK
jgi:thiol-disulfide isomerase/thioredoxin